MVTVALTRLVQLYHECEIDGVGNPLHVPVNAEIVAPTFGAPVISGEATRLTLSVTATVLLENLVIDPWRFEPVTPTMIVDPGSLASMGRAFSVAFVISAHPVGTESLALGTAVVHRYHW